MKPSMQLDHGDSARLLLVLETLTFIPYESIYYPLCVLPNCLLNITLRPDWLNDFDTMIH